MQPGARVHAPARPRASRIIPPSVPEPPWFAADRSPPAAVRLPSSATGPCYQPLRVILSHLPVFLVRCFAFVRFATSPCASSRLASFLLHPLLSVGRPPERPPLASPRVPPTGFCYQPLRVIRPTPSLRSPSNATFCPICREEGDEADLGGTRAKDPTRRDRAEHTLQRLRARTTKLRRSPKKTREEGPGCPYTGAIRRAAPRRAPWPPPRRG